MKISLHRIGEKFAFEAKNETGNTMVLDTSFAGGGEGKGFTPMELLVAGVAGCSGIDIVHILRKQRQEIDAFSIETIAEKEKVEDYSVWKKIHLVYKLKGKIDAEKALRAATLSHEKYCSVSKALHHTSEITFEVKVNEN
jgi:putative redox protein